MLAFVIFGIIGYQFLPVSDLPTVDFPTLQVSANLPGASPETMASTVATPLEKQFSTIAAIDSMSSTNTRGSSQITCNLISAGILTPPPRMSRPLSPKAARSLPADMPTPPTYQKLIRLIHPSFFSRSAPHPALVNRGRIRRNFYGSKNFYGRRSGPGSGFRLAEICGSRST